MKSTFRLLGSCVLFTCVLGCSAAAPAPTVPEESSPPASQDASDVDPRYAQLPTPGPAPDWAPPAARKTTLENGLTIWEMGGTTTPLVSIHLLLPTGSSSDPKGKEGLSLLSADMLDEGAGKMDALELSDHLGELATDYGAQAGVDYVLLSMDGLTENLSESLATLADIVRRPRLSADEFQRRKDHHIASAIAAMDDPEAARHKAVNHVLFGDGYASGPASGTKASLDAITLADVKLQVKKLTVPEGAHLTVAGKFDSDVLKRAVEKAFGTWKGKLSPIDEKVAPPPTGKNAFLIDFPGAAQSALAVVTQSSSDQDADYFPEEVMNEKVGGSFTGRINMNLREDKGFTYGAFSTFRRYEKAGYFGIFTNVKTETTGASVKEIYSELSQLCDARPLSVEERNEAVEGLLLGFPMQFDEVSALGHRLVTLPVHDRPVDFWETWPGKIKAVTTQDVNAAAAPFCRTNRYSVVVAGDAKSVTALLEAQGFHVAMLDRDGLPLASPVAQE